MTDSQVSQYDLSFTYYEVSPEVQTTQYEVTYVWNLPTVEIQTSSLDQTWIGENTEQLTEVSQFDLLYVYKGRADDPKVRCFTFTLDSHDFYGIRLGTTETLIFDTMTEQFYVWGSGDSRLWRAYDACNWLGGYAQSSGFGSNIVVGDDGNGAIYFLDPDGDRDDDAIEGSGLPRDFLRQQSGQAVLKGYTSVRCYGLELLGSVGQFDPNITPTVSLSYSDDRGSTYQDAGTFTMTPDAYDARIFWRSLGSMRAPGRIFRVSDYGAVKRIDSLTMVAEGEGKT